MSTRSVTALQSGEGPSYWLVGDRITIKTTGEETAGAYSMFEAVVPPGGGPPPHIHHREDEAFYVLEGQFEFWSQDGVVSAGPGTRIYGPKDVPHTFKNVGTEAGKLQIITSPAGFETFVAALGTPSHSPEDTPEFPDIPTVIRVAAEYGIEILPPPDH